MSNKESVRLRQRKQRTGNISLYLDIYRNGKRQYEYLKLYLIPETNREAKEKNRQTLRLAEAIRSKRTVEIINDEYGFVRRRDDVPFYPFAEKHATGRNHTGFASMLYHVRLYDRRENLVLGDITGKWIEGFAAYLRTAHSSHCEGRPLRPNTQQIYYNALRTIIKAAYKQGLIAKDPTINLTPFKREEVTRTYLTVDEIRILAQQPFEHEALKRAFLFACLTGLRRSDIWALTWSEVSQQGEFTRLTFKQKKTGGLEYLDISPQAAQLLGERKHPNANVFGRLVSPNHANELVRRWVLQAGIQKDITFHCARHSFAIMMLDIGTDIYTVSKLLGHRELATTQIYAKVLDKNKQKAVANIPAIFG